MIKKTIIIAVGVLMASVSQAQESNITGAGTVAIGYTILDQTGDLSASPETYDVYEDPALTLRDFALYFPHRYTFTADLENLNLDNRGIRARFSRPGRVTFGGTHRRSRRIYDSEGDNRTYRDRTSLNADLTPHKAVRLSGGYSRTGRDGSSLMLGGDPFIDVGAGPGSDEASALPTDYDITAFRVGAQVRHQSSMVNVAYESSDFEDNLDADLNREGRTFRVTAYAPVPSLPQVVLTGGLTTGWTELDARGEKRKENLGWGGANWSISPEWLASYRLRFSRTDNEANGLEVDNAVSTALLTKRWPKRGEVTVGYEFRSQDDLTDRTETNAFLFKGSARLHDRLKVLGQVAISSENDDDRTTLLRDEDRVRQRWNLTYRHDRHATVTLQYRDRKRDNDQIGSTADYSTVSSTVSLRFPRWGQGAGTYSYSNGEYTNATEDFRFEQHSISARAQSKRFGRFQFTGGLTYLRSRLGSDVEKIIASMGANVGLTRGYEFAAEYKAHNYDDFLLAPRYYTANVVTVELRKSVSF